VVSKKRRGGSQGATDPKRLATATYAAHATFMKELYRQKQVDYD
jgi:hypothetical protein